jgi:hypothetical protein
MTWVSVFRMLGTRICAQRSIALRGRPKSQKVLDILEGNEAFEKTELFLWNDEAHPRRPLVRHYAAKNRNAAAVG